VAEGLRIVELKRLVGDLDYASIRSIDYHQGLTVTSCFSPS
jgi:hypothetical protein